MSKPTKSSTKSEKALPIPRLAPSNVCVSQETLETMRQCEAREWISRFNRNLGALGRSATLSWWDGVKRDIEKRRGKPALDDLVIRMRNEAKLK